MEAVKQLEGRGKPLGRKGPEGHDSPAHCEKVHYHVKLVAEEGDEKPFPETGTESWMMREIHTLRQKLFSICIS